MTNSSQQKQAEDILTHLVTTLRSSPPEGLSVDDVDGFMERNNAALFEMVAGFLKAKAAQAPPARKKTGSPTPWGGVKGDPLKGEAVQEGVRVVLFHGEHGVIKKVHQSTFHFNITDTQGKREKSNVKTVHYGDVLLDTGRVVWRTDNLWEEIEPPTQVVDDIKPNNGGHYHSPREYWSFLKEAWGNIADYEGRLSRARTWKSTQRWKKELSEERGKLGDRFDNFKWWRDQWPDAEVQGFDPLLYRQMTLAIIPPAPGTGGAGLDALTELSQLKMAPEGWQTKWKPGASIRYFRPGEGRTGEAPPHRGVIDTIQGHHATLSTGEVIPLWMLHFDTSAPTLSETFDKPTWLISIALEMAPESGSYPKRAIIAKAVKGYLAAHGVAVYTRVRRGSMVTGVSLTPKGGGKWSAEDKAQLEVLLPTLNIQSEDASFEPWAKEAEAWDPGNDYGARGGGLSIPAEHIAEVAKILARAMKAAGHPLNLLGEQRAVADLAPSKTGGAQPKSEDATTPKGDDCFEISFNLAPYGEVRVACGKEGRRATWHNIHAAGTRYGWNGKRWAKRLVPPEDILNEVSARGVTVFEGGR